MAVRVSTQAVGTHSGHGPFLRLTLTACAHFGKGVNSVNLIGFQKAGTNFVGSGIVRPTRKVTARIVNDGLFVCRCDQKFDRLNALIKHQNETCSR